MSGNLKSRPIFVAILLLIFLGLILYSHVLNSPFVFDDYRSIVENESIRSVTESLRNISSNRYLPLLSFALNYAVSGLKPFGYHFINNLIHIINALLVYYLIILTFKTPFYRSQNDTIDTSQFFIAFSSAFVFIAHPIQTQAVNYVVQRSTLMATMFYLLSLVMYIKVRLDSGSQGARLFGSKSLVFYFVSLVSAILAMKSKEIAFTLPFMVVLCELCFFGKSLDLKSQTPNWKKFFYIFPLILTMLIIPLSLLDIKGQVVTIAQDIDIRSRETVDISRADYLVTQFRVMMTYLRLLIFPVNQNFDYDYPVYHSFLNPQVFLSFLVLLSMFGIGVYLLYTSRFKSPGVRNSSAKLRLIAFGIFWFFITLSVESSIIPIRDVIVEHRLYLPSIGLFIACASLIEYLLPYIKVKAALMVIILVLLSIGTCYRNVIWKDPQTLWTDVIAKAPNNARAYNNLGVVFKKQGEFDKAIKQFEKSLKANRRYTDSYFNLGDVQYRLGNYENAVAYLKIALAGKPDQQLQLDILNKLGRTYSAMGQTDKAIETFEEAVKLFPSSVVLLNNLGVQYMKNDQIDSAIEVFEKAIKRREQAYLFNNLASAYAKNGDEEKSRLMSQKALELGNNNE